MRLKSVKQGEGLAVQNSTSNRLLSVGNPLLGKYFALFASQIDSSSLIFSLRYTCIPVVINPSRKFLCFFFPVIIPQSQTYSIFAACNIFEWPFLFIACWCHRRRSCLSCKDSRKTKWEPAKWRIKIPERNKQTNAQNKQQAAKAFGLVITLEELFQ